LAKHGIDFIRRYGFDNDGRMFFQVTRDGRPIRKRRYLFTETFGVAALAAYAQAANDDRARQEAVDLFNLVERYLTTPDLIPPKFYTENRSMKGLVIPMIMTVTAQILRNAVDDPGPYNERIDRYIDEF
jgi:N-acylglucosamine 2-epimerase